MHEEVFFFFFKPFFRSLHGADLALVFPPVRKGTGVFFLDRVETKVPSVFKGGEVRDASTRLDCLKVGEMAVLSLPIAGAAYGYWQTARAASSCAEYRLVAVLERGFRIAMDDLRKHPLLLFSLGVGAGGLFGAHIAAFSLAYTVTALSATEATRLRAEAAAIVCMLASRALASATDAPLLAYFSGRDLQIFFGKRRLTTALLTRIGFVAVALFAYTSYIEAILAVATLYSAVPSMHDVRRRRKKMFSVI